MTAQIARRFDNREGFDLIDYAEVGLPIFRLTAEAVTLDTHRMPSVHEFILRAILIGEDNSAGVAALLGLSEDIVLDAVQLLRYDGLLNVVQGEFGELSFEITDQGNSQLANGETIARDETLVFDYDGIRRRPIRLGAEGVLRPGELSSIGAIQLRPYPANSPEVHTLSPSDVGQAVRRITGKSFARTVLAVKKITRKTPLFRRATGLLFKNRMTGEFQLGFVIGSQLAEDYEIEFSRHGGAKKPGLIRNNLENESWSTIAEALGDDLLRKLPDRDEVGRARQELFAALDDHLGARAELQRSRQRIRVRPAALPNPAELEQRVQNARASLDAFGIRQLTPYEQYEYLTEALTSATTRLIITTDKVQPGIVDSLFIRILDRKLDEGVQVQIETTEQLEPIASGRVGLYAGDVELWLRANREKNLTLTTSGTLRRLHFLIKDDDLALVSNRPFLSGRQRPLSFVPTFGVICTNPTYARLVHLSAIRGAD